jgi:mannitol/fructose-specific phosphotransferase system IIA component (Ntr-type)
MIQKHNLYMDDLYHSIQEYDLQRDKSVQGQGMRESIPCSTYDKHLVAMDKDILTQLTNCDVTSRQRIISTNAQRCLLSKCVKPDLIDLNINAQNRKKALSYLAKMASFATVTDSYEELFTELDLREQLMSTAIGRGVAIPHFRFPLHMIFDRPKLVIARSYNGLDFDAPDGQAVHWLFMPCASSQSDHIRLLAQIVKFIQTDGVLSRMDQVRSAQELIVIIKDVEDHIRPVYRHFQ